MNRTIRGPEAQRLEQPSSCIPFETLCTCLFRSCLIGAVAGMFLLLASRQSLAVGTWTPLANTPPTGVNNCLLLSDGTVLALDGSADCNKLTPDIHGSYINGTWTRLAPMNASRLFYASQVLTNGTVFVAGGEYGAGHDHAELYDPLNNIWTRIPDPIPGVGFSDCISAMLPNGNVLLAPVSLFGGCRIYNVTGNSWQTAASAQNQNEVCWVRLPSDNILTIDTASQNAEHYVPSLNEWVADAGVPVPVYGEGAELGPGFLLPNGNVFYIGGTNNTAIYTPGSTANSAGSWVAGPVMLFGTNQLGALDAPAAMMVNGKIICCLGPMTGGGPSSFFEYDYTTNAFTSVPAPTGGSNYNSAPFGTSMLCLPDGSVLFVGGQNSQSLYIYTPDGSPIAFGQPAINNITENSDGSYRMTGTGLNGISAGAAYGDDEQMESDYPLVRITNNSTHNVYYARTFNWNNVSLQTGSKVITTQFTLPQNLPAGTYSLVAVANGNASVSQTFTYSPPGIPSGLTAHSGSNGFVQLSWSSSPGATAYNIKRATASTGYFTTLATVTGLGYTNTGLTNGLTYYYKVAAIGTGGPSSDSAAVSATPAGPTVIPGATAVSLSGYYNRTGIVTDGHTFSSGFDGGSSCYSANLLGPSIAWDNLIFTFGPANSADVISCTGQTINLTLGRFNSIHILAAGVNGSQQSQTFTVTYTDNSTATFTQSFSDWASPQSYPGEFTLVSRMPYRDESNGSTQILNMYLFGYVFTLDQTKGVKSITLPNNSNLVLLCISEANDPVQAALSTYYNRAGIYTDGTTYTNPPTFGIDGDGFSYSGTLLGNAQVWSNVWFAFGPLNATNVISCSNQTVTLPPGNYSRLRMLGTAVNGTQTSQSFLLTYSDATSNTFVQSFSDWATPKNYSGETTVVPMSYRNNTNGSPSEGTTFYLYGYSFTLNSAKTVQSIRLPNDGNVVITAMSLVPNWPPTFTVNPFTVANANAGQAYSGTIATNATDLNGDALTFSKVSGPAWLNVAANGALSGTPLSPDVGANAFVVQVADPGALSSTATMNLQVIAAPPIVLSATPQSGSLQLNWTGGIAPYQVYTTTNLINPAWIAVGPSTNATSALVSETNSTAFYKVGGN